MASQNVNQKTPRASAIKSSKTFSTKNEKSIQIKPTAYSIGPQMQKAPGWQADDKYCYTDKHVQKLLNNDHKETSCKRPKHQPRVNIKIDEKLLAEAAKINEMIEKMNFQMPDEVIKSCNQKNDNSNDGSKKWGNPTSKEDSNTKSDKAKATDASKENEKWQNEISQL